MQELILLSLPISTTQQGYLNLQGNAQKNIRPVAGIEFRNDNELQYIGIARNNKGLQELNEFLSNLNFNKSSVPFPAPHFSESYVIYSLKKIPTRKLFDNERIGIKPVNSTVCSPSLLTEQESDGTAASCHFCRNR